MWLPILVACIASAASKITTECSTCIKVNTICHNTTYLFNLNAPFRDEVVITKLGILRSNRVLYYAFEPKITDPEYYKVGYVSLENPDNAENSGIVTTVSGNVNNFHTFDIDQDTSTNYKIIVVGGSDGVALIDPDTGKAGHRSLLGDTITNVFVYNRNVLFTRLDENKITEKNGDVFKTYKDYLNVKNFVIDKNNNLVFLNSSGLYVNRFKTNQTMYLSKNNYFRGLTLDLDDTIYTWWLDGIYKVNIAYDLADSKLVKIASIPSIGAVTFDNDNNFIFTSGAGLFRLTPTNETVGC